MRTTDCITESATAAECRTARAGLVLTAPCRVHEAEHESGGAGDSETVTYSERVARLHAESIARETPPHGFMNAARDRIHGEGGGEECGAVYVTNTLGGMDICARPSGHAGGHDWRRTQ